MADLVKIDEAGVVRVTVRSLDNLGGALRQVGAYLETEAQAAFRRQGRGSASWPPRMVPNVPGIVRDLNAGATPKARRFVPRPALVDTGRLRQSIRSRVVGRQVIVGTTVPYARVHNDGGESVVELTPTGRKGLVRFLKRRKELRGELGWLFSQPRFTVNVRPRPFLQATPSDERTIRAILEAALTNAQPRSDG